ncbi:hypothetical protein ILYODFUR_013186 [Ilyodon furcidens]|uniref:Uncharacterized protein n=1 Tax=Ilyodon furcidens TaxID=33524 RepID=A0ABV0UVI5_9TELE
MTSIVVLANEILPHTMKLTPPCFIIGIVCSGLCGSHTMCFASWPISCISVLSDQDTFSNMFALSTRVGQTSIGTSYGFLLTVTFRLSREIPLTELLISAAPPVTIDSWLLSN